MTSTYAVLGAGNGGCAMAADLSLRGRDPILFDYVGFDSNLLPLREAGGIVTEVRVKNFPCGIGTHFAKLGRITNDVAEAAQADILIVVVPGQHHRAILDAVLPHLRPGHVVLLAPGGVGGTLLWHAALRSAGCEGVQLAQIADLPHAGHRTPDRATVVITGKKKSVRLGVFPHCDMDAVLSSLRTDFPEFIPSANALDAGLDGPGMLVHPLPMLMNAVRIDRETPFAYDAYDITPSVARAVEALDRERMAIVFAIGGTPRPIHTILSEYYDAAGYDFYDVVRNVTAYRGSPAPSDFSHRYLTEDVPVQIVPSTGIARLLGIETPVMDATVVLAGAVAGKDFAVEGWTLARLGLGRLRADHLPAYLQLGPKSIS